MEEVKFKVGNRVIRLPGNGAEGAIATLVKDVTTDFPNRTEGTQVFEVIYGGYTNSRWSSEYFKLITPLEELL